MAQKITPRGTDFSQWYLDIVLQAKLADYSPVKGCMVIRPNGYAIWEKIQKDLDRRIKETGARNAYFPLFIPESFLKKEAEHVEGFAPQCAVVTYAGAKDLEERLVVRPTSETVINSMFAQWIQSYRDLPMMVNQWANVVRWEMRTRLFLRTTEFLWQEGHTCHETAEEAEAETRLMLSVYRDFAHEVLAMPVLWGRKSESEKFAGALRTYCIEAMMQDTKALQAGTSHNLSTHFANAFDTKYLGRDGKQSLVHQTSWGVSTRLIGGMIMTHSDDKGLVLPPRLATHHVVIVPFLGKADQKSAVLEAANRLASELRSQTYAGESVGVFVDADETKQAGWKYHEYELLGTPIRIDLGPRDLEKNQAVVNRRDIGTKDFMDLNGLARKIPKILEEMQAGLLSRAQEFRDRNTHQVTQYSQFKDAIENSGGFFESHWCGNAKCESRIKDETKATIRLLPLNDEYMPFSQDVGAACLVCGKTDETLRAVFARSY